MVENLKMKVFIAEILVFLFVQTAVLVSAFLKIIPIKVQ